MVNGPYTSVDDLIDSSLISVYWRYELSGLQFDHRWRSQNLPVEKHGFDQDLPVYWIGQPTRVDSWRLEWVS